ncbi:MAG: hypothetical protein R3B06_30405 [Kofleriaceae bacterium]
MKPTPPLALTLTLTLAAACGDPTGGDGAVDGGADAATGRPDGVALCYSAAADNDPATAGFWAALGAGDRGQRAAAIDALDAAATRAPDEEELHLLLGLAHLWRLAEPLPDETSPAAQLPSALAARDHLRRAYELCPTDHRIPAWLGPLLVRFGRTTNDQATVDEGLQVLDQGIAHYPSFVLFSKLLVYADYPRDAPEFQQALDAVVANTDACAATPGDPACADHPRAAHNREGGVIFFADALIKAGRKADAVAWLDAAVAEPGYASWAYQQELTDRLATIDARIAAYATPATDDDPVAAWASPAQCAMCHTY